MTTAAIILAGGSGSRTQRLVNKVYIPIGERPMLAYCLETFERAEVSRVILVIREEDRSVAEQVLAEVPISKPTFVVRGGPTRHQSEMAGLDVLAPAVEAGEVDLVAIHDGARPFMTLALLEAAIESARHHGGAVPGLPVETPLYQVNATGPPTALTVDDLRRVQTPQVFWARPLLAAYRRSRETGFEGVDTAETVERFTDLEVEIIEGDPRNIKVTFIEDFFQAEKWAFTWDKGEWK